LDGVPCFEMRGTLDVCHGLFGLLALLDQDERRVVASRSKKKRGRTGFVDSLDSEAIGLHVQQRTGRPLKTTGNGWESESGRRERRIRGGGEFPQ
jgi:hypothetical protein